jgi:hypothetical protein
MTARGFRGYDDRGSDDHSRDRIDDDYERGYRDGMAAAAARHREDRDRGYERDRGYGGDRGYGDGQSGYAAGYHDEPRDHRGEAMGYGGYGRDDGYYTRGRSGYGRHEYSYGGPPSYGYGQPRQTRGDWNRFDEDHDEEPRRRGRY